MSSQMKFLEGRQRSVLGQGRDFELALGPLSPLPRAREALPISLAPGGPGLLRRACGMTWGGPSHLAGRIRLEGIY